MKKFTAHIIFVLALVQTFESPGQEMDSKQIIESIIESQVSRIREGNDVALIIEDLEYFAENPININATSSDQLSKLYVLNEVQIKNLMDYLDKFGPAYSIYELQTIKGFSKDNLQLLQPFISFGQRNDTTATLRESFAKSRHQMLLRTLGNLQKQKGYKPKADETVPFEGNRLRYYMRYNFAVNDQLKAGFTAEKDPGEAFFKGSNKHGFDFNSAYVSLTVNKTIKNINLGDYIVRAGQGLVLWQGYTSGKSENVLGILKTGQGARPYTSVDENLYFRGTSTTLQFGNSNLLLFYSQHKMDGNIASNDSIPEFFTSLQTSGYHRTLNEIADEKSVGTINTGAAYTWVINKLKLGATFLYQQFDKPYMRSTQLYNRYRFSGRENFTGGLDYLYIKGAYQMFGEVALSKSGGFATTQGAIIHFNDQLSFSALFRHFDKNYHALWANTFAEGSSISNESGLYFGAKFLPAKYVTLSAYSDIYQSRWINYTTASPAKNWDILAQLSLRFSNDFDLYMRFKNEEKEQKYKDSHLYINLPERIQKTRLHFNYRISEHLLLKSRIEHAYFKAQESEHGILILQDVQAEFTNFPIKINGRLAWFSTKSYDSRIYAYENDILYTFSIPAYYGKGIRTYANISYRLANNIDFWLKLGNTYWTDRNTIGSGYSLIEGKNKTELKIQLRLKF